MPSRLVALTIVIFWLGMTGLLFYQEIWPLLEPDAPPPFAIDLVDETRQQQSQVRWKVYLEGTTPDNATPVAKTEVKYNEKAGYKITDMALSMCKLDRVPQTLLDRVGQRLDLKDHDFDEATLRKILTNELKRPSRGTRDLQEQNAYLDTILHRCHEKYNDSFTFNIQLNCIGNLSTKGPPGFRKAKSQGLTLGSVTLKTMNSCYRVSRSGRLLSAEVDFLFDVKVLNSYVANIEAHMDGEMIQNEFVSEARLRQEQFGEFKQPLKPIKVSYQGSVLMPMHPVNRIKGLRRGQHWRMPVINPLGEALSGTMAALQALAGQADARILNVRVLPQTQLLPDLPEHHEPVSCLVIEYDDEEMQPRTWVQEGTGLVLRQEATVMPGARLIMQRETIGNESD